MSSPTSFYSLAKVGCFAPVCDLLGDRIEGVDTPLVDGEIHCGDNDPNVVERVTSSRLDPVETDAKRIVRELAAGVIGWGEGDTGNLTSASGFLDPIKNGLNRQIERECLALRALLRIANRRRHVICERYRAEPQLPFAPRYRSRSRSPLNVKTWVPGERRKSRSAAPGIAVSAPLTLHDMGLSCYLFSVHFVLHPPARIVLLSMG